MNFESKRILSVVCVAVAASFFASNAKAQSGTRGGYSAPAASAPAYTAPAYTAPAPQVRSYQAPAGGVTIATGAGCSGPGCSGNVAPVPQASSYSAASVYQSPVVYPSAPSYQPQPIYSSGYGSYSGTAYRRTYAPAHTGRRYYRRSYHRGCGN